MRAPGIVNQQVANCVWPHGFAMHAVVVVDLEVAIEGCLPPGAREVALGIQMPVMKCLIREFALKFSQPFTQFECLSRGQADEDDARASVSAQLSNARAAAIDIGRGLLTIDAY